MPRNQVLSPYACSVIPAGRRCGPGRPSSIIGKVCIVEPKGGDGAMGASDRLDLDLAGQTALVTGASRGIGAAVARLLAGHGARVAIHYRRDHEAAERVQAGLRGEGHAVIAGDLADPEQAGQVVATAIEQLGDLGILVNNAGIYELHSLVKLDFAAWHDVWQRVIGLNLLGPAHVSYHAAKHMIQRGGGRVVNVSSRGAFRGEPDAPAYGAAKAGLNALSQSLAQALAPHGITVTVVAPGFVATDMTQTMLAGRLGETIRAQSPLGRVATAEEVARVVLFLAAGCADSLTGAIVDVNGASYLRS
jgi:3-oxoacyl-[acyl-carrier protein] reductase